MCVELEFLRPPGPGWIAAVGCTAGLSTNTRAVCADTALSAQSRGGGSWPRAAGVRTGPVYATSAQANKKLPHRRLPLLTSVTHAKPMHQIPPAEVYSLQQARPVKLSSETIGRVLMCLLLIPGFMEGGVGLALYVFYFIISHA